METIRAPAGFALVQLVGNAQQTGTTPEVPPIAPTRNTQNIFYF